MPVSLNKVFLAGNLTRDPETRFLPSGSQLCKFGLAVNRYFMRGEEKEEETSFFDIETWGKQAEVCGKYLAKGRSVLVEGRLRQDSWEAQDGQKRSKITVVGERIHFLSFPSDSKTTISPSEDVENQSIKEDDLPF